MPGVTLTDFLLARITEDEIVAQMRQERGASGEPPAMSVTYGRTHFVADPSSPARVLAECEAKRGVVGLANAYLREPDQSASLAGDILRTMALPYADHPDYDESWRP